MPGAPKAKPAKGAARFEARLERLRSRLNWVVIYLPFDAAARWGLRGQIKVKGEINGYAFRTSLFPSKRSPSKEGQHFLLINKRMQKGARAVEGSVARFRMELDLDERVVTVPAELERLFKQDRALRRWHDALNHSTRNDIAKWISEPKSADTKTRRAEQIAERLLAVMDAERELPPILQVAFARRPSARDGWDIMAPGRRRGHLLGIFGYKMPESRGRRIDKMLDDAEALAEKKSK
ncbi:MAG TPA: YdeI/OmpD-associated family protein [Terriglobales bacterium]|nr:YdeI/OmpD-associated family protein [Terriglobales bacterium]